MNNSKKVFKNIIISSVLIVLLIISACFSTFIDKALVGLFTNKLSIISKDDKLLVHFINVGSADAIAINFPNGEVAVLDTGSQYTRKRVVSYINNNVINHKKNKTIDYLFYSHADSDHTGGVVGIIDNFNVKNIYRSRQYAENELVADYYGQVVDGILYQECINSIYGEVDKGAIFNVIFDNQHIDIGDADIDIYAPLEIYENSNDYSYYIKLSYKGKSFLFTGDATTEVEEHMLNYHLDDLDCDIIKVAHHGSDTSSSINFINAVSPIGAIISVGENSAGHPSETVLLNLKNAGVKYIYRTDDKGNIVVDCKENFDFHFKDYVFTPLEFCWYKFSIVLIVVFIGKSIYLLLPIVSFKLKKKLNNEKKL